MTDFFSTATASFDDPIALLMACHSATCTYMIHIVGKVGGSESMMGSALAVTAMLIVAIISLIFVALNRRFLKVRQ